MMNRYALALAAAMPWAFAQAQNTCSTALPVVAGVVYTVDTVDGTTVPLPVCSSGGTGATAGEWYVYTATEYVTVIISSDLPQNGNTDTRVQVYTGDCNNLTCLVGDDDSGTGLLTVAMFNAFAGQSYLIAWDNRYSSLGFDFTLTEQPWDPTAISFTNLSVPTNGCSGCGQAAVDMNNDGYDDVVTVTASNIRVNYQQPDGTFSMVDYPTTNADYTPSWSIAAGDIDANGYLDLLYGGGQGVTFMYASDDGTAFSEVSGSQYVFSQRSNFVDINNDGHLDAFVCHDVQPNVFYLNDGTGALDFNQGGLGNTPDGGNYGSIWIDYNNDRRIDLFIAKCRGGAAVPASVDQMHRNNGDGTFTEVGGALGLGGFQQSWSSAWADFDMDGDMDVLIGASSFAQGGHMLMRNDGDVFTDVTEGSGFDVFAGTSVEWVAHDFNNDGWVDVLGASSTIHFNNGDMTFTPIAVPASSGSVADLNSDGFLDVLNGGTIRLNTGNDNNWVRINLQGTLSNINGIGARVELTSPMGTQMRDVKSGDGFRHMSFIGAHFGLGTDDVVEQVTVYWPSGQVDVVKGVAVNTATTITESLTTGLQDVSGLELRISPNPAVDRITIAGAEGETILRTRLIDASGKAIAMPALRHGQLDVSGLAKGSYLLELETGKGLMRERFSKL
ncbi:MAG: FG-GAP-like repeat-containing protein [Flavobacteriales bacterium]|nr:MAG: FG-GAP-like repeat-containing protein [Flavobacteriales bacterium]